ncbi:MAG: SoxR reducing system RseC family protein [Sideroxydans sp.]|jgi:sigma-E factor negative regulatory protein RseC
MNEMRAIVLELHGDQAEISPVGNFGCSHCNSGNGCGSGKLAQMFCSNKLRKFTAKNSVQAQVGDEVNVALPQGMLLHSSLLMYMLPLILLLGGALLGASLGSTDAARDGYAVLGALVGLLTGFAVSRVFALGARQQAVVQSVVESKTGL